VTREELLQDLSYARTLAEEGRRAPLIGGAYLVMFGVLLAVAYSAQYLALTGALPRGVIGFVWLGFGAAALVGSLLLRGRTKTLPGASSISNRADRTVWQGVALAILFVVAGAVVRGIVYDTYDATNAIMAAGFGLYGVALYSTATLSGHMWLRAFAWLAWSLSGTMWFFLGEPWAYVVAAVGSILVLLVPGFIMMRAEPSKVV
jgi:hypothetical protein